MPLRVAGPTFLKSWGNSNGLSCSPTLIVLSLGLVLRLRLCWRRFGYGIILCCGYLSEFHPVFIFIFIVSELGAITSRSNCLVFVFLALRMFAAHLEPVRTRTGLTRCHISAYAWKSQAPFPWGSHPRLVKLCFSRSQNLK